MPSSSGASSRAGRAVSAAAAYRELRVNRTVYVMGTLLLLAPWLLWLKQLQDNLDVGPGVSVSAHTLVRTSLMAFTLGSGFNGFSLAVAGGLGIALFAYDRTFGGLFYSLTGPLRRREVWLGKARYGAVAIVAVTALGAAGAVGCAALSGNLALTGGILMRALFGVAGQLSLFATALAMGGAMGTVFSCLATLVWVAVPSLVQGLLLQTFWPLGQNPAPWLNGLAQTISYVSPFLPNALSNWSPVAVLAVIAWFLAWAALMAWQGPGWWARAPFERLQDGFFFPFLWNLYYAFLALVSGLVLITVLTHGMVRGPAWDIGYAALSAAGWFFWRWVVVRQGRVEGWRQSLGARP